MTSSRAGTVRFRPWVAVASGVAVGAALAAAIVVIWPLIGRDAASPGHARLRPDSVVALFRGTDQTRQIVVVRSGADASGEVQLARGLFPGEAPARELASVLLVNAGAEAPWDVDLDASPLRARAGADAPWEPLVPLRPEQGAGLDPALALRFRALAGPGPQVRVGPGSLRRVLVALPKGRTIEGLSDVQWGDRALARERMDVEAFHALRDPDAAAAGRAAGRR